MLRSTLLVALATLATFATTLPANGQAPGMTSPRYAPPASSYTLPEPTEEEQATLDRGTMHPGRILAGGAVSIVAGFGLGHTVQGRWLARGWMFTTSEIASLLVAVHGESRKDDCREFYDTRGLKRDCDHIGRIQINAAIVAFLLLRVGEAVDAFLAPSLQNRRHERVEQRLRTPVPRQVGMYIAPTEDRSGSVLGLDVRF